MLAVSSVVKSKPNHKLLPTKISLLMLKSPVKIAQIKRRALDELLNWRTRAGRKPLVLSGARQVGKSRLARVGGGGV
jgi:hypothetical protein